MSREGRPGTVLVVARDPMYAARVEAGLRGPAGWCVEVGTPGELPGLLQEHPDALVVLALGEAETRRTLRARHGSSRRASVVALSESPARLWTSAARALGLAAALPLRASSEELDGALRAVRAGLLAVHPEALAPPAAGVAPRASGLPLTAREREILELLADGANNRVIAARLVISRHTVKFHVASILAKLGAGSRTEAVALALRTGLIAV